MPADDKRQAALEDSVRVRLLYLNPAGYGGGVLAGIAIFVATNWLVLKGGTWSEPHRALLVSSSSATGCPSSAV